MRQVLAVALDVAVAVALAGSGIAGISIGCVGAFRILR